MALRSSHERTPLLGRHDSHTQLNQRGWSTQGVVGVALGLLCACTCFALVQVAQLTTELRGIMSSVQPIQLAKAPELSAVVQSATPTNASSTRVLIVYPSGTHLNQLAGAVTEGALGVIGDASLVRSRLVEDASFTDDVLWADAIILGSHVMNANVEPKMATFLATWDFSQDLSHKVGAAFVTGGGMSAGEELTMVNLLHSLLIFRMVIVGGERWTSAFGASAVVSEGPFQPLAQVNPNHQTFPSVCYPTDPDQLLAMFRDKAVGLGRRVAILATVMRNPYP